ncbi:MAG: farnesyl diphosphate synthase [Woeseiaceae bacterium]|nr:farnesyl diphosphate synthase [Woeseiaceae bacterium]
MSASFGERIDGYVERVDLALDKALPAASEQPERLHEAMRYAVFNGGKRVRPLLVYATGECLDVNPAALDAPATAIELIHAFSLVHDDLPAMDDDDLRRGKPTVHRAFDEATAILAADALQPLAFQVLADLELAPHRVRVELVRLLAGACGSIGMTGGQSIDLDSEGKRLSQAEVERMFSLKTGALIHAAVVSACLLAEDLPKEQFRNLDAFARGIGLAFQIKDDILDVEGETDVIGKPAGSDAELDKASYPGLFGLDAAHARCDRLLDENLERLDALGVRAEPLRWLARYIVHRGN